MKLHFLRSCFWPHVLFCLLFACWSVPAKAAGLQVVAGNYHTLAVRSDGTVWAWGDNTFGQLGDGTTTARRSPVQVSGLTGVIAVSASSSHSLALKSDGTIWAWGNNSFGRLGDGTTTPRYTPVPVSTLSGVIAISAGFYHSLALKSDGSVWAWGNNDYGQLGDGTTSTRYFPGPVSLLTSGVIAITAGDFENLALKTHDGAVWGWGHNGYGQLGDGSTSPRLTPVPALSGMTDVRAISLREYHSLILKTDGTLWACGGNYWGQLGDGTTDNHYAPVPVTALGNSVASMAAGYYHSVAVKTDGSAWTWGYNAQGTLGDGTPTDRHSPVPIGLSGVTAASAGVYHMLAVRSDEKVFGWGYNYYGQIGDMTTLQRLKPSAMVSPILLSPGKVMAKGWNQYGQATVPVGLVDVVGVSAGDRHSLALRGDATLTSWGDNTYGQSSIPGNLRNVVDFDAGWHQSIALSEDGTVVCWGANDWGQLNIPAGLNNVVAVKTGEGHCLALKSDGTVVAWGLNNAGQTTIPAGLNNAIGIAAGLEHSVAFKSDGTVVAWGRNDYGQTAVPAGLNNVAAISAGDWSNLALKSDGSVTGWGLNSWGSLDIPSGLNAKAIAAGGSCGLAIDQQNFLVGWGGYSYRETEYPGGMQNIGGISAGNAFTLVVRKPPYAPLIATQPQNQYAPAGYTVNFTVTASTLEPVTGYQWQFNQVDIAGATSQTLTLNNVQASNQGSYRVKLINSGGFTLSSSATFTLVLPPAIVSQPQPSWQRVSEFAQVTYSVTATGIAESLYPLSYQWRFNGVDIPYATASSYSFTAGTLDRYGDGSIPQEGSYTAVVRNAAGSVVSAPAVLRIAAQGYVDGRGDNGFGQADSPIGLGSVKAIAAGFYHSLAVRDDGTVAAWGLNNSGQTTVPQGLNNVVSVAAGYYYSMALKEDGTVVAWGSDAYGQTDIPAGLNSVIAIAAGGYHAVALKSDGTVVNWGYPWASVPQGLSDVTAISAGYSHSLALKRDGTLVAWGQNSSGQMSVPAGLNNVVAISAGGYHSLALKADGTVVGWGANSYGQATPPVGLQNVLSISGGYEFSLALKNDGTPVAWGRSDSSQTQLPTGLTEGKLVSAGGIHALWARFSSVAEYYPLTPSKDILLVYRAGNADSVTLKDYYLAHRPQIQGANVLGITCTTTVPGPNDYWMATDEEITKPNFDSQILAQYQQWLAANPTKRPQYLIFFLKLPSRVYPLEGWADYSVIGQLRNALPGIKPFINYINMGDPRDRLNGTYDLALCQAYIDKLQYFGNTYSPGRLVIRPSRGGYGNNNYYFDDKRHEQACPNDCAGCTYSGYQPGNEGRTGVRSADPTANVSYVSTLTEPNITSGSHAAGYLTWGAHSAGLNDPCYGVQAYTCQVQWTPGTSGWWILNTIESFNGYRRTVGGHLNIADWWAPPAATTCTWGGGATPALSNAPIGGVGHVSEPGIGGIGYNANYFGLWAKGKNFAICAANAYFGQQVVVGDPLVGR